MTTGIWCIDDSAQYEALYEQGWRSMETAGRWDGNVWNLWHRMVLLTPVPA